MTKAELLDYIKENFSGELEVIENEHPEPYFIVKAQDLVEFSRFIHDDERLLMTFLMNLSAVDTTEQFEIVYNVCSYRFKHRIYFKIIFDYIKPEFDSVIDVWRAADWYEREIWELFGINVKGHPNLKRFLLPDDWDDGYPMRKGWQGKNVIPMPERK
ncbi:MAG: NADH-quinone oxidoreductase subunit C [candidate division Zixibacteria bacterium]